MEYEQTLIYTTVERFSCKETLALRKRYLELTIEEDSHINLRKELEHVNKKLEERYEIERNREERLRNQKGVSGK